MMAKTDYMRILIVEDESDLVEEYKIFLEAHKHQVVTTVTVEECLAVYEKELEKSESATPFDIVILDYQLPKKNGMDVAKIILDKNPKQRILFASAYVEDTLKDSIKELKQIVELLQKPFSLKTLLDVIEDTNIFKELEKLNVDIKNLKDLEPTHSQIRDYLSILKTLQKKAET